MLASAIRTENLTRDFKKLRAVDSVTLDVPQGIIFGFLGPNGSGKTTTIHLLLGLLKPTYGRAEVFGFDTQTHGHEIRARSGALLEHNGLYERLTAEQNLDFFGRINGMTRADRDARIHELLSKLNLWDRRREKVRHWSRGMKQKLAIARVLLHRPPLVILDEPTAGFDPLAAAELRADLLKLVADEGVTVFLNTHHLFEAEKFCNQVAVIHRGKLVASGKPSELRARQGTALEVIGHGFTDELFAKLRVQPDVTDVSLQTDKLIIRLQQYVNVAPLVSFLVSEGVQIEEVHKASPSLEEVFVNLISGQRDA